MGGGRCWGLGGQLEVFLAVDIHSDNDINGVYIPGTSACHRAAIYLMGDHPDHDIERPFGMLLPLIP